MLVKAPVSARLDGSDTLGRRSSWFLFIGSQSYCLVLRHDKLNNGNQSVFFHIVLQTSLIVDVKSIVLSRIGDVLVQS